MKHLPPSTKKALVTIWKSMSKEDQDHFINQTALMLVFFDKEREKGADLLTESLIDLVKDDCKNLADIGLYIVNVKDPSITKSPAFERTCEAIRRYRFRNDLPGEPRKILEL